MDQKARNALTERFIESMAVGLDLEIADALEAYKDQPELEELVRTTILIAFGELMARVCWNLYGDPQIVYQHCLGLGLGAMMGDPGCQKQLAWKQLPKQIVDYVEARQHELAAQVKAQQSADPLDLPAIISPSDKGVN